MSGSEIVEEWKGKQVSIKPATRDRIFRGEVVRSDAVGLLLAVEFMADAIPGGERLGFEPDEHSHPLFLFLPWAQIEVVIPSPGELP